MTFPRRAAVDGRQLRTVRQSGAVGDGKVLHAALLCILWIVIVWLLYASLVDTSRDERTNTPAGKTQLTQVSKTPQYPSP